MEKKIRGFESLDGMFVHFGMKITQLSGEGKKQALSENGDDSIDKSESQVGYQQWVRERRIAVERGMVEGASGGRVAYTSCTLCRPAVLQFATFPRYFKQPGM